MLLKDDSKTSTKTVRENASIVRTLFDLFWQFAICNLLTFFYAPTIVDDLIEIVFNASMMKERTRWVLLRLLATFIVSKISPFSSLLPEYTMVQINQEFRQKYGPLTRPFASSLAPLTRSLAPLTLFTPSLVEK